MEICSYLLQCHFWHMLFDSLICGRMIVIYQCHVIMCHQLYSLDIGFLLFHGNNEFTHNLMRWIIEIILNTYICPTQWYMWWVDGFVCPELLHDIHPLHLTLFFVSGGIWQAVWKGYDVWCVSHWHWAFSRWRYMVRLGCPFFFML